MPKELDCARLGYRYQNLRIQKMARAYFNKRFHKLMAPQAEILEAYRLFKKKRSRTGIRGDICMGPEWLSVAAVNEQLPEMPNAMPGESAILQFGEGRGEEKGERFYGMSGYMTCTLSDDPGKAIGCLCFNMDLHHNINSKELRIYVKLDGVTVDQDYRRMRIASVMGLHLGNYISEKIAIAAELLNHKVGWVVLFADFNHEGGAACFGQMEAEIEANREFFPELELASDAGW